VDSYVSDPLSIDYALNAQRFVGKRLLGVVLNRVPAAKATYIRRKLVPFLERRGIMVLGLLPEDELLHSITVRTLADELHGECIACKEHLDRFVTRPLIGAMTQEGAMRYLKRVKDSAVITGGDRVDIQLVTIEAGAGCIILTGGIYPNEIVAARAEEKATPIIVVNTDTFTVVEAFREAIGHMQIREESKIRRAAELVRANVDFDRLTKKLKLSRKHPR
ncbi:MAG: phosphotransacetylase family protein, partial [Candidatus Hydrogenedentota bacterium]